MTDPHSPARVRDERPGDEAGVAAVIAAAFATGAGAPPEVSLVDDLRAAGAITLALVAEAPNGTLVGHVAFSPVTLDGSGGGRLLGLAPLAVVPACQGKGVGSALVAAGLARARALGIDLVFVLGDPAYYRRFGFAPAAERGIAWEHPAPPEAVLAVGLTSRAAPGPDGVLRYHPAFNRFV